jgi:hypothetical protein
MIGQIKVKKSHYFCPANVSAVTTWQKNTWHNTKAAPPPAQERDHYNILQNKIDNLIAFAIMEREING